MKVDKLDLKRFRQNSKERVNQVGQSSLYGFKNAVAIPTFALPLVSLTHRV